MGALSVASERLVEIVKSAIPILNQPRPDPRAEGWRQATLHLLAAGAGVVTTALASTAPSINNVVPNKPLAWIVIGLLASGGSGFWNSIQTYVNKAKDVKSAEADAKANLSAPALGR